jgi:glutamate N-acetyltransferase/amino-acid N-acetyltransferase
MTTDTVPKELAFECSIRGGSVRLGAMAKGSGMIAPNMATMLAFITTDAAIAKEHLQPLLRTCVEQSFNRICVDNDMSTNDMVLCLANGRADAPPVVPGTPDYEMFAGMLRQACLELAHALVRDGEGASKFVTIAVEGAASDADALRAARAIAQSQLCKTAFAGEDPNWGRIGCAAGYSGAEFDPSQMDIWIGEVQVLADGLPAAYREEDAAAHMRQRDVSLRVRLGAGPGRCTFWTSDLSHEYVTINADYRT